MKIVKFIKDWTLPISMLSGILGYFVYVNIHALDSTHEFMNKFLSVFQPLLLFCMLFVSFCKVHPRELKPQKWMMKLIAIQACSFILIALLIILFPDIPGRVVLESFIICMICPTATAASVVTTKLEGNPSVVVSYTVIINLVASIVIPSIVPFMHEVGGKGMGFLMSFSLIIGKVFPLLIMPLLLAWFVRYMMPSFHAKVLARKDLAFNLWAVALALAIAITVKAIVHSNESLIELIAARRKKGKAFTIIACAEGANEKGNKILTEEEARKKKEAETYSTVGYKLAADLERLTGQDARVVVPGHYQRGGPPCPYDRVLATQFGAAAAELIENRQYGRMVAMQNGIITSVPIEEAASKTKFLPPDHEMVKVAREIGICMGD